MVRCFECQWYVYKGCAIRTAARGKDRLLSTNRDPAIRSVQAFTENTEPATVVNTAVTRSSATDVDDRDLATAIPADDGVVDAAAAQCSVVEVDATTDVNDENLVIVILSVDEAVPVIPIAIVDDDIFWTQASVTTDYDDVKQPEVTAVAPSEIEIDP
ncbi:uncharacterized protein LOC112687172 [Sipha flava]|uniref:Uncharacterized protein LOC112687172 n=1 Tax=Sipha flava TaxID=143950 RepID=A0A8B8FYU5_9HEMI|nr:uncharacterized protein LOC112687172 [Sipha flava]